MDPKEHLIWQELHCPETKEIIAVSLLPKGKMMLRYTTPSRDTLRDRLPLHKQGVARAEIVGKKVVTTIFMSPESGLSLFNLLNTGLKMSPVPVDDATVSPSTDVQVSGLSEYPHVVTLEFSRDATEKEGGSFAPRPSLDIVRGFETTVVTVMISLTAPWQLITELSLNLAIARLRHGRDVYEPLSPKPLSPE